MLSEMKLLKNIGLFRDPSAEPQDDLRRWHWWLSEVEAILLYPRLRSVTCVVFEDLWLSEVEAWWLSEDGAQSHNCFRFTAKSKFLTIAQKAVCRRHS